MKVAVIGAGVSGLTAAYYLSKNSEVTVFEAAGKIGGHTATVDIDYHGEKQSIDTGFIVYNDWTYPNFIRLLSELDVATRPTRMSFSVTCEQSGLEYAGSDLNGLFADRKNLVSAGYWKMLRDILRFNRESVAHLDSGALSAGVTLGEYLRDNGYGKLFREKYLVPMGAAIWSSGDTDMLNFPMLFFVRFFKNHGLLSIKNRPQWHTIVGGSAQYLEPLTESFRERILTDTKIKRINRSDQGIDLQWQTKSNPTLQQDRFDALVIATHSDQALDLLNSSGAKPSESECDILSKIPYVSNEVVLHTDESLLPVRKRAWCSWNYRLKAGGGGLPKLTYNMNILQGLQSNTTYCVSLNQTESINPDCVLQTFHYSHPLFTLEGMDAQQRWSEIAGPNRTWFCGAYWRNGFHEDGVSSALKVVESISQHFAGTQPQVAVSHV